MSLKKWQDLVLGDVNPDAGSSLHNMTNFFRQGLKPQFQEDICIQCFFCWVFCPENAITIENERVSAINYDYCKGCGICAYQCPVKSDPKPITMVKEDIEL